MVIKCASNWQVSDQLSCLHQCLWVSLHSSYLFLTWASSKSQHKFEFCQYCTQSMQAQFNHYINVTWSWYSRKCQWPDVFVGNMQLCFLFSMFRNIFPTMLLGNNGVAYKKNTLWHIQACYRIWRSVNHQEQRLSDSILENNDLLCIF